MPWEWNPSDTHLVKKLQIHRGNETYTQCEWNTQIHSRKRNLRQTRQRNPRYTLVKQQQNSNKQNKNKKTLKDTAGKETPGVQ